MKLPVRLRLIAPASLLVSFALGCIRDLPELPPAQEGVEVTGQAFSLDPSTGNQAPVAEALVRIVGTGRTGVTDAAGRFAIRNLPLGRFDLSVQGPPRESAGTGDGGRFGLRLSDIPLTVDGASVDLGILELGVPGGLNGTVELTSESGSFVAPGVVVQAAGPRCLALPTKPDDGASRSCPRANTPWPRA